MTLTGEFLNRGVHVNAIPTLPKVRWHLSSGCDPCDVSYVLALKDARQSAQLWLQPSMISWRLLLNKQETMYAVNPPDWKSVTKNSIIVLV